MSRTRLAFVLEYALGHATHADNLKQAIANGDCGMFPTPPLYIDLPFQADFGAWAKLPPFRSNWTLRASLAALLALRRHPNKEELAATFFHTQVTAQFAHAWMQNVPSVVSLDATPLQMDALGKWYDHKAAPSVVENWKKRITEKTFRSARRLIAWSEWAKGSLIQDYGIPAEKITVIPPGIDTKRWDFSHLRQRKHSGETLDLLFVGGDFVRKGGDTLLEAWRQLPAPVRQKTNLHLVTKSAPSICAEEQSIRIYSDISPNDSRLLDLFARADMFVFPTQADCLALAVMEALAAGLPVITTEVAAIPEAVTDNVNGLIVPVGDAKALTNAILHLCTEENQRERMSQAAHILARERFDSRTNYRRLVETVQGVARMKTLLLIPSLLKTGIEEAVSLNQHPRMDYFALRDALLQEPDTTCDILGYAEVDSDPHPVTQFLRKSLGRDTALAFLGYRKGHKYDAVFTNGENVGLPLALLWKYAGNANRPAHITIGHRLSTGKKRLFFEKMRLHEVMDTIFVYAETQRQHGQDVLKIPAEKLRLIAFHADDQFFRPLGNIPDPQQICAAGLEWRDYPTLIHAVETMNDLKVRLAAASPWSKHQNETERRELPSHVEARRYDYAALRELYAESAFGVVPLYENDFQAGVTTVLELMAMGKTVLVTRTTGQTDVIIDGENGFYIEPGATKQWQACIELLRQNPAQYQRIGNAARVWIERNATLDIWTGHMVRAIKEEVTKRTQTRRSGAKNLPPVGIMALLVVMLSSLAVNVFLVSKFSSQRAFAQTAGKKITYGTYQNALETRFGRETLRRLVLTQLIGDAARKAGVYPSEAEVAAYDAEMQRTTPLLYEAQRLKVQESQTALQQEMATLLALENLRIQNIEISPVELQNWWRKNHARLRLPIQAQTIMVATPPHDPVKAAKIRSLLAGEIPPYLIAKEPDTQVVGIGGYEPDWANMPPNAAQMLNETIFRLQQGEVTSVDTDKATYTIRLLAQTGGAKGQVADFETLPKPLQEQVARVARLEKAPTVATTLKKLYKEAHIVWEMTPYAAYLNDLEAATTVSSGKN